MQEKNGLGADFFLERPRGRRLRRTPPGEIASRAPSDDGSPLALAGGGGRAAQVPSASGGHFALRALTLFVKFQSSRASPKEKTEVSACPILAGESERGVPAPKLLSRPRS